MKPSVLRHRRPKKSRKIFFRAGRSLSVIFSKFFFRFLWPRYSSSISRMTEYLLLTTNNEISLHLKHICFTICRHLLETTETVPTRVRGTGTVVLEWRWTRDEGFSLDTSASRMNSDVGRAEFLKGPRGSSF